MSEPSNPPGATQPYLSFLGDGFAAVRRAWPSLLVYESVWKFLTWMVLGPLGVALLQFAIRCGGDVAVANTEIVSFALSPIGFITLLFMATVLLAVTFFERAGLYYLLHNALIGRRVSSWKAWAATLRAGGRILGVALLQVGLFLVVLVPFVAVVGLTYKLLLTTFDINFYLADHPWQFVLAAIIGAAIGLAAAVTVAYLCIRWAFAVPVALFEGRQFAAALRGSASLVKGWGWQVFGAVLCWELFRFVFYWLVFLAMKGINELALRGLAHASGGVLGWVAGLMVVDVLIFIGIGIVETTVFCLVITLLYENMRRRQTAPEPLVNQPEFTAGESERLSRQVVFASIGVMFAVVGIMAWQTIALAQSFRERHEILVTAHRAGAESGPENTLAALRQAIDQGADFAEIDVQRTRDGVVVVLHDRDLKRLTGDDRKIWDITYEDLKKLSYKTKKHKGKDRHPSEAGEAKIATLEDFMTMSMDLIKLNIELKYYPDHYDKDLARIVVAMVDRLGFGEQCVITSLEPKALKEVRKLNPNLKTGVIVAAELGNITLYDVNFLSLKGKMVSADLRHLASSKNLQIHAWEVESRADMEMMIHLGVDNLITDRPRLAMEVRQWYQSLSDVELILFHFRSWLRS